MSQVFDLRGLIKFETISYEVLLSVFKGVGGCGCPIAIRSSLIGIISCAFINAPLVSASADDDTTFFIVLHNVKMGPFGGGSSSFELVK